ncbi:MAG: methylated-DNA--[protein]-cysteine S-methyltransferase [Chloroflexota bacterium]
MREMREKSYDVFETGLGWIGVVASPRGVLRMTLPEPSPRVAEDVIRQDAHDAAHAPGVFVDLRARIESYFKGEHADLSDIPIDLQGSGSSFFVRARMACRLIPSGETRTYAWLASAAGSPRASRAAGQAMARNPLPLLVPCHRVIGSDGGLHGFGGSVGLSMKDRLLRIESEARERLVSAPATDSGGRDSLAATASVN